jgi:hypothetical protein
LQQFRRPARVFQDVVASGGAGLRILGLEGAVAIKGSVPTVLDGKIVESTGATGGTGPQHGVAAKVRADAVRWGLAACGEKGRSLPLWLRPSPQCLAAWKNLVACDGGPAARRCGWGRAIGGPALVDLLGTRPLKACDRPRPGGPTKASRIYWAEQDSPLALRHRGLRARGLTAASSPSALAATQSRRGSTHGPAGAPSLRG